MTGDILTDLTCDEIERAAQRMAGSLVASPIIGGFVLSGHATPANLRVKADLLQLSGSTWFRGALHAGVRALGVWKGVVTHGSVRRQLAQIEVARQHRVPVVMVLTAEQVEAVGSLLPGIAIEVVVAPLGGEAEQAGRVARERGFRLAPTAADRDYALGLATLGLELVRELPAETDRVIVPAAGVAVVLAAALRVLGSRVSVVEASIPAPQLADAARLALRLDLGATSLAALAMGLATPPEHAACVVLTE